MICKFCGEEFTPKLKHPGYINVCLERDCQENREVPKVFVVNGPVAQLAEHLTLNQDVVGSTPTGSTKVLES